MRSTVSVRFACLSLLCLFLAGCGMSYPYYTLDGSPESRVVTIHLAEGKTEKIPAGTGIGAGLTQEEVGMLLSTGGPVIKEQGKAKVTLGSKGAVITVQKVEYDGKEVFYHEPVL
jgi:hypothetical protein